MTSFISKLSMYTQWDETETKLWLQLSAKGKWHFIWNLGVFRWGGFMLPCLMFIAYGTRFDAYPTGWSFFFEKLAQNIVLVIISGLAYGYIAWHGTKASFEKKTDRPMLVDQ